MHLKPFSSLLPSSRLFGIAHGILSTVSLCFPPSTKQYKKIDNLKMCARCQMAFNYCCSVFNSKIRRF